MDLVKIKSPINSASDVEPLAEAGADEFFAGVLESRFVKRYSNLLALNRRAYTNANLNGFDEIREAASRAHGVGAKICFCVNEFYSEEFFDEALKSAEAAANAGVDILIVADVGLLRALAERKGLPEIHLGTGATVFGSEDVKFFSELGVKRITLPRHMTLAEIERIAGSNRSVPFECFIVGGRCLYVDGYCRFLHGLIERESPVLAAVRSAAGMKLADNAPASLERWFRKRFVQSELGCWLDYEMSELREAGRGNSFRKHAPWKFIFDHYSECGICALPGFRVAGIHSVKVLGRENLLKQRLQRTRLVKEAVKLAGQDGISQTEFEVAAKDLHRRFLGRECSISDCLYPDETGP